MLICYLKILPCARLEDGEEAEAEEGVDEFARNHRCREHQTWPLPLSRSSEGCLINPQAGRWGGRAWFSWQRMATGGGPCALRFKCASHFHGAEHAHAALSLAKREREKGSVANTQFSSSNPASNPLRWPLKGRGRPESLLGGVKCFGKILLFAPRTQQRSFESP